MREREDASSRESIHSGPPSRLPSARRAPSGDYRVLARSAQAGKERIAFGEHSPYAEGARHRLLRTS